MVNYITEINEVRTWETLRKVMSDTETNFISGKIQKKSEFILNSGNSYVTLQLELCLVGS